MKQSATIQWLGHSCFKITGDGYSIVLDPYQDGYVPGFDKVRTIANQVLCSHEHDDHGYREAVEIKPFDGECPWRISVIDTWHDEEAGARRGANKIHILDLNELRIVHMGDLGCVPTAEQIRQIGNPDVLLIPTGGYYTIDAVTAKAIADLLEAKMVIPMHYRSENFGFDVLQTLEEFTDLYEMTTYYDCDSIVVFPLEQTEEEQDQVVVLEQWGREGE